MPSQGRLATISRARDFLFRPWPRTHIVYKDNLRQDLRPDMRVRSSQCTSPETVSVRYLRHTTRLAEVDRVLLSTCPCLYSLPDNLTVNERLTSPAKCLHFFFLEFAHPTVKEVCDEYRRVNKSLYVRGMTIVIAIFFYIYPRTYQWLRSLIRIYALLHGRLSYGFCPQRFKSSCRRIFMLRVLFFGLFFSVHRWTQSVPNLVIRFLGTVPLYRRAPLNFPHSKVNCL